MIFAMNKTIIKEDSHAKYQEKYFGYSPKIGEYPNLLTYE